MINWIKKHPFLSLGGAAAGLVGYGFYVAGKAGEAVGKSVGGSINFGNETTNPQEQCKARLPSGDTLLSCRYKHGHEGNHKTCYIDGREWK